MSGTAQPPPTSLAEKIAEWGKPVIGTLLMLTWGALHALAVRKLGDLSLHDMFLVDAPLVSSLVGYYYGSSSGSQKKDATIAGVALTATGGKVVS